jgi:MFS family permease
MTGNRRTAVLMSICYAVALFHRTAFQGVDGALRVEFAMSPAESADLAALFFWTYLAAMIPVGLMTDSFGARRVSICGSLVVAVGALLFWRADSVVALAAARMLIAAGSVAGFVGLMRFVSTVFPERKATFSGRGILVGNLGAVASGAPLAILLTFAVWRDVFLGLGLMSLALAGALWLVAPAVTLPLPRPRPPRKPLAEMLALFGSRHVYVGIALQAGLAGSFYAFGNLIGPRWMAAQGVTSLEIGWVTSALILGYGFGAAFWGWFGDKEHQRTRALLFACCAAISCWILLPVFPFRSPFAIAPYFFVIGACCGAFALVYPLISERHSPSEVGGVIACVTCGIPLGAAVLQTAAGRMPPTDAPWLLVAASGASVCCSMLLLRERHARALANVVDRSIDGATHQR